MKVKMVTQYNCIWCERASALLDGLGIPVDKVVLDTPAKKQAFKAAGHQTVPLIYINGFQVGGHDALVEIIREGLTSRFPGKVTQ